MPYPVPPPPSSTYDEEVYDFVCSVIGESNVEVSDDTTIAPYTMDITVPSRNFAISCCDLFADSFPNRDKKYHMTRHKVAEAAGIRLITMYEDEWNDKRHIVKDTLRHLLGGSEKGVYARKTTIREIPWQEAKAFLIDHHLLGAGQSGNYRLGAFDGDELISVMSFGMPSDERGRQDIVEMKRFVTNGKNNAGVGSKMFKHAVREKGYNTITAFVDQRWFTGSFKLISGFECASETLPAKFWTDLTGRFHRRFKTKASMMKTGEADDMSITKEMMLDNLGYFPIYDAGKLKFRWEDDETKKQRLLTKTS